jgi:uncharacterized peroxidase-related enzyme
MRGPSAWSVADRELMAAYVSEVNESAFCVGAHTATARRAYQDGTKVQAVLADLESAPVEEPLRATLRMLGTLTAEGKLSAEDMREVLSAGVSRQQVEDALVVCVAFDTTNRLADAFGFEVLSPEGFEAGAKYLLKRGTGSAFSLSGAAGASIGLVLGSVLTQAAGWRWITGQ